MKGTLIGIFGYSSMLTGTLVRQENLAWLDRNIPIVKFKWGRLLQVRPTFLDGKVNRQFTEARYRENCHRFYRSQAAIKTKDSRLSDRCVLKYFNTGFQGVIRFFGNTVISTLPKK
jgi:hypothetical protein